MSLYTTDPYCGESGAKAAGAEIGRSLLGMFGAGDLIPNNAEKNAQKALQEARETFNEVSQKWTEAIENQKNQIVQSQIKYLKEQVTYTQTASSIVSETLGEQLETHGTLIGMLVVLVIFLILFDIL
jgi:preprotein translocase subunit SecF